MVINEFGSHSAYRVVKGIFTGVEAVTFGQGLSQGSIEVLHDQ